METGNRIESNQKDIPSISVIVPVYNGQAYLDRCVQSMLAQTCQQWELLIVDGASVDNTAAICAKWAEEDSRIRICRLEENHGVSAGRNIGMQKAKGEYLMFLDADDWLMPDCLERLYADIQEPDVQIAGCSFKRCSDEDWQSMEGKELVKESFPQTTYGKKLISGQNFLKEGILQQDTRCWSKLYHRSVVENQRFREDFTIGEDMLFLWETAKRAKQISASEYPGYCYYYNVNGTMLKPFRESDIDQIRCWQLVLEEIEWENRKAVEERGMPVCDRSVISKTGTILLTSCMLVAGKLSKLSPKERKKYGAIRKQCSKVLKEAIQIPGAYAGMDWKYRVKTAVFYSYPSLYLSVYQWLYRGHVWLSRKRK